MFRHSFNCYLIERIKRENELQSIDKGRWYEVNTKCMPEELLARFHQCRYDAGTDSFIANCYQKSASVLSMFFFAVARSVLKIFMSSTSVCGLLGCGSMFVFSEDQFRDFAVGALRDHLSKDKNKGQLTWNVPNGLECITTTSGSGGSQGKASTCTGSSTDEEAELSEGERLIRIDPAGPKFGSLIDLGAGDGNVTGMMAPYFERVYTTEMSRFMHTRLNKRGYQLLEPLEWHNQPQGQSADLVCLLNVLDRCDRPLDMLADIHRVLTKSNGLFLLAVVFPLYQFVEYKSNHQPEQYLPVEGGTFEHQVASFVENVLKPAGFQLIKWTKLPYLCEGNIDLTYFWLIDAVFLLKPVPKPM